MSPDRPAAGRLRLARVLIALATVTVCAGAVVAYAATRPEGARHGPRPERLLRPQLLETPAETTAASDPQFRFHVPPRVTAAPPGRSTEAGVPSRTSSRRFQCRVDGGGWRGCRSPTRLAGLAPGSHRFAVRVFNREGRVGEATGFSWVQTAPETAEVPTPAVPPAQGEAATARQFSIVTLQNPEELYPGQAPTPIPVRIVNPNGSAIEVTEIAATIGEAPAGCTAENFELIPAGASAGNPLVVGAGSSVDLPAAGVAAPAIRMLNLPVEQDSCRGAEIPIVFSGKAHG
ncbi:MAG: hypothetical protein JSU06_19170 [Actinobacteria bacterium]|nr:hypothetical protein [Actinomycetota bacterium]